MSQVGKYSNYLMIALILIGIYSLGAITMVRTGSLGQRAGKKITFTEDANTAGFTTGDTLVKGFPVMTFHVELVAAATVTPQCGVLKADGTTKKWANENAITATGFNTYSYPDLPCDSLRFTVAGGETVTIYAYVRNW